MTGRGFAAHSAEKFQWNSHGPPTTRKVSARPPTGYARMRGLGEAGRAKIESSQLWDHRVPLIASVIESVLTARTK